MSTKSEVRPKPFAQLDSRMLASGLDLVDYLNLQERCIRKGEDWPAVCEEIGDKNHKYAEQELAKGHRETAGYFFFIAQVAYRLGQYGIMDPTEEKLRLYHKLDDSFHAFAKLSDPPMERVEIPYKNYRMEGWLILPKELAKASPVVLMIPGASGFKEEFYPQARNMVDRGLPVLLIDGPGQGTTLWFNKGYLEVKIEDAYKNMVDFLERDGRFGKVGVIGGSTGGYYVARAAAVDKRIKVCIWNSGSYYPMEICDLVAADNHRFALLCGVSDEKMKELWPQMTLTGLAERITCPFLIVHGETDNVFSLKGAQRAYDEAKSTDKELKIYPGAWHYQMGAESEAFRYMADWMRDRLRRA